MPPVLRSSLTLTPSALPASPARSLAASVRIIVRRRVQNLRGAFGFFDRVPQQGHGALELPPGGGAGIGCRLPVVEPHGLPRRPVGGLNPPADPLDVVLWIAHGVISLPASPGTVPTLPPLSPL